jgi:hypothetical protein
MEHYEKAQEIKHGRKDMNLPKERIECHHIKKSYQESSNNPLRRE